MTERLLRSVLAYVDQVSRSGSIQGAAKELNVSASAIDRQILLLEAELGVALFERQPRGMRTTAAGDVVVTMARRWRGDIRRVVAEIRQLEGVRQGHLRIAAMDSLANGVLPRFIARMRREHPKVTLELETLPTDAALLALLSGTADIGLVFNLGPHREIRRIWSAELPFGCVMAPGHELAAREAVSVQQAAAFPLVLQARSLMIRRYLESHHGWLFQEGPPPVTTNSLQLIKQLARSGAFVAFTSELDAAPEIAARSLVFVPVRDRAVEAQSIAVVTSARLPLGRLGQLTAEMLAAETGAVLAEARAANART